MRATPKKSASKAPRPRRNSTRKAAAKPKPKKKNTPPDEEGFLHDRLLTVESALKNLTKHVRHIEKALDDAEGRGREKAAWEGFGEGMSALSGLITDIRTIETNIRDIVAQNPTDRLENALGRAVMLSLLWFREGDREPLQIHRILVAKVLDILKEWASKKDVKTFEGSMDQALARSVYDALGGHSILD